MEARDQVDENGVVKNRRRISRPLVRAALIMDIVVDIVVEDVAVEDTEDEATVEMANQDVGEVAIEDVVMPKQQCSNCIFADSKSYWMGFPYAVPKAFYDLLFRFDAGQNQHTFLFFGKSPLLS